MKTLIRMAAAVLLFAPLAFGAVTPQEAAHLGEDLTPLGGEKAANADGSIPAWTGGIRSAAEAGFQLQVRRPHRDPYANDRPLFTSAGEPRAVRREADRGHKALFRPIRLQVIVYPTHRGAAVPDRVAETTKHKRTTANLVPSGSVAPDSRAPFPDRRWAWRCTGITCCATAASPLELCRLGRWRPPRRQLHGDQPREEFYFPYYVTGMTEAGQNVLVYFMQETTAPARLAGGAAGAGDARSDQGRAPRWILPGSGACGAPQVAFDSREPIRTTSAPTVSSTCTTPESAMTGSWWAKGSPRPYNACSCGASSSTRTSCTRTTSTRTTCPERTACG
jgi:hypothetical protein